MMGFQGGGGGSSGGLAPDWHGMGCPPFGLVASRASWVRQQEVLKACASVSRVAIGFVGLPCGIGWAQASLDFGPLRSFVICAVRWLVLLVLAT